MSWESLPQDLLFSTVSRLSIPEIFTFRSVCKSWSSPTFIAHISTAPHLPWLIMEKNGGVLFYNETGNRYYSLPALRHNCKDINIVGSQNGWLAIVHKQSLASYILNPLTAAEIRFPSLDSFCGLSVHKIAFSIDAQLAVAVCGAYAEKMVFAGHGDVAWTPIDTDAISFEFECEDVVCHDRKFFALSRAGEFVVLDFAAAVAKVGLVGWGEPDDGYGIGYPDDVYLVSSGTDLLKVIGSRCRQSGKIMKFVVKKFNGVQEGFEWVGIESLGDRCLFVSRKHSQSLSGKDVKGLKGNCIYFMPECRIKEDMAVGVQVFDMETGQIEPFLAPCMFDSDGKMLHPMLWFMPSLL